MSPSDGDGTDAPTRDVDDAPAGLDSEWFDRHARIECQRSDRWVRAESPTDDWEARHSRTKRHN